MGILDGVTLAVVDLETTGLSPRYGDRICEVAVLRVDGEHERVFESLVNPGRPISPGATAVHGIWGVDVRSAPSFQALAPTLWPLFESAIVVAHNAPFDLAFLAAERHYLGLPPLDNPVLDSLALARRDFDFPRNSLGFIAEALGIPCPVRHRAMADVRTTLEVLTRLLEDLAGRGLTSIQPLLRPAPELVREEDPPLPPALVDALDGRRRLRVRYLTGGFIETVREVEPLEILPFGDYLYLRAYCHLRQDERTFRLDRILELAAPLE